MIISCKYYMSIIAGDDMNYEDVLEQSVNQKQSVKNIYYFIFFICYFTKNYIMCIYVSIIVEHPLNVYR